MDGRGSRMENGAWQIAILYTQSSILDRLHLRGAGETTVNDDDLAGDEAIVQNQA